MRYTLIPVLARNVLFSKQTEYFLKEIENKTSSQFIKKFIKSNLRNWLINYYKASVHKPNSSDPDWIEKAVSRGDTIYDVNITNSDKTRINHWLDYLATLDGNKISKISVPQLIKQVEKWDKQLAKNLGDSAINEDGIKVIGKFDGFTWVDIFGKDSLKREGESMGHCVGGDQYYKSVKKGDTKIYSLRDSSNNPHVTIEYDIKDKYLVQIKGKENKPPVSKYRKSVIDFIKTLEINSADNTDLLPIGIYFNKNEEGENKLQDFFETGYLSGIGSFEFENEENALNLEGLNFSDIKIINSKIKCRNVTAQEVAFYDSYIDVENVSAEEDVIIEDCDVHHGISIQSNRILINTESNEYFSIQADSCQMFGDESYFIIESEIDELDVGDNTLIEFGSDVNVREITVNGEELSLQNTLQIKLGEHNRIEYFAACYSDVKKFPKGFNSEELRINLMDNIRVSSNVEVEKLIINDFSDIYELTPKEIFEYVERFHPSTVSYSNYGELAMSEEDYIELSDIFKKNSIEFIQD